MIIAESKDVGVTTIYEYAHVVSDLLTLAFLNGDICFSNVL